ncbi:hypothetical protein BD310DRAFT_966638 [Dichomitus squalens]|uniref:Uncharacterized protein n=1 Tax=Dichomitus squalens TaxID=114155 RepID=A0A4Q9Q0M2_9APHY|nr:hypothetical protein BD310DRAFT_966638 [Dichomitus squalens]
MDNASVNDVLARKLAQLLLKRYQVSFAPENAQIHCVAHVVNLIVQKILSNVLDIDDPALADYYELYNKHLPIHYDLADDEDLKQWETEGSTSDSVGNQDEEDANASDIEDELGGELQDFVSGNFGNGSKAAVDKASPVTCASHPETAL